MKIYNTLTRTKEEFVPIEKGKVRMYACGITVSGEAHIGHGYQALIYDIMRKFLQKQGFEVSYARNYTDVDDKIIAKSKETGIPADKYAAAMIKKIDAVMGEMDIGEPDLWLKATQNIGNVISFIKQLIESGHAYAVSCGEISWDSPWGKGRPGWHIECSAMTRAAFGDSIDIHGGGRDLVFPHHENEIAQSESLTGKQFAKYWTHNGLIKVNGQKMSKSLGNSILLEDLLKNYSNEAVKFALLQFNYRVDINLVDGIFDEAERHLTSFYKVIKKVEDRYGKGGNGCKQIDDDFNRDMSDDFNTALALSRLFGLFKAVSAKYEKGDRACAEEVYQIKQTYSLLGLFKKDAGEYLARVADGAAQEIPDEVKALADKRWRAKQEKDWAAADALRGEIDALGYVIKDTKDGYTIVRR